MLLSLMLWGQGAPRWLDQQRRALSYPSELYVTGFAVGSVGAGETAAKATLRVKREAQAVLSEGIRVRVQKEAQANSKSLMVGASEQISEMYESAIKTATDAEIVGVTVDSYYDEKSGTLSAFAYADRQELISYHREQIALLLQQVESDYEQAVLLTKSGAKPRARKLCAEAVPVLAKVACMQDFLVALGKSADSESLQRTTSLALRGKVLQMVAELEQSVFLYVESTETLMGRPTQIIANTLKAALAKEGCAFTDSIAQADFTLTLSAESRTHGMVGSLMFCYADVVVELTNSYTRKRVYQDEFSQKGGGMDDRSAARRAFEDVAPLLAKKLRPWLKDSK
jgi:hypothetical protein